MSGAPRVLAAAAALAALCASSCAPRQSRTEAPAGGPEGQVLVVLLPDGESGAVGQAVVSNAAGSTTLDTVRASTTVIGKRAPTPAAVLDEEEIRSAFDEALDALPPAPSRFTLFFRFDSEELTDESRRLVPDVMTAISTRPVPDVVVIGHTDTTGSRSSNVELGLRRARVVRALLIEAGLPDSAIDVRSHGEGELLVKTADDVFEPRNRRVEIAVR
jgi:outer membrane protein OmpA-like peptidoglycan-associated protein